MAGIAASLTVPAQAATRFAYDLQPIQIANGIWMIEGARDYFSQTNGGAIVNIAMLDTDAGLVIIDTGPSLKYGEALRQIAGQLTGRGVAGVILTHHHPDHFFGNMAFQDVPIRALSTTDKYARMHGDGYSDAMYRILGDWMRGTEVVPPNQSLPDGEITIGGRRLQLFPLAGHTEADLAILDTETGTLIAGDLAFYERAPTTPDADLGLWRESLSVLEQTGAAAVIPGHGPIDQTGASLIQTRAYLDWLDQTLRGAIDNGLDMVEVMEAPMPAEFARLGAQPQEFHRSVSHLFPDLEAELLPLLNK
jgi:quinoprotein relay system zinc metallohydrolase 1